MPPRLRSVVREFGAAMDVVGIERYVPACPGPGEVAVRMTLASINPSDKVTVSGAYASRTALPFVPGFEGVGVVEAIGPDVHGLTPGQRVLPLGSAGRPLPMHLAAERPDVRIVLFRLRDWVHTAQATAPHRIADALAEVFALVLDGTAASQVAQVHPLSEVRQALRQDAAAGRRGKVLLRLAD